MKDFSGKAVVVTGAATGIGFALAKQFARHGARLVLAGRRHGRLEAAAADPAFAGVEVDVHACDVARRDEVEALADFAWKRFGRIDAIINNAGVGPVLSTVIEAAREDVQRVLDVNLFGAWNGVAAFGRRFVAQGTPAAILNVGSENCFFNAVPRGAGYVASKHALFAMTMALREEVPDHIAVALICPGLVKSELSAETAEGMDTDEYATLAMRQILEGRFLVVSHAHNMVRIKARSDEIAQAYATYAPRYDGDDEFDVRTLGARHGWWTARPDERP